jgi:hypothetical protein
VIKFVASAPASAVIFETFAGIDEVRITASLAALDRTITMSGWNVRPLIVRLAPPSPV